MPRLIVTILLVAMTAGAVAFAIMPQWRKIGEARAAVGQLQALHEELTRLAATRDTLIADYNTIADADLEKLKNVAPANPKTTDVLTDFEELARRNSLIIGQIDFMNDKVPTAALAAPGAQRYGTIPVTFSIRGNYENFREFLVAVEHDLRIFDADEIIFASAQGKEATISLKGRIYFRR